MILLDIAYVQENLESIMDCVLNGEDIVISVENKPCIRLVRYKKSCA